MYFDTSPVPIKAFLISTLPKDFLVLSGFDMSSVIPHLLWNVLCVEEVTCKTAIASLTSTVMAQMNMNYKLASLCFHSMNGVSEK